MQLLLLFLLTMLCMSGLLGLIRFVVQNFFTDGLSKAVLVIPLVDSEEDIEQTLIRVRRYLYWSEEQYQTAVVDCGLLLEDKIKAKHFLQGEDVLLYTPEEFITAFATDCKNK